ncbi:ankyrin repeat domain-containing protein [Streptomyces sp. NPDC047928]|uniref:ankyrin repeat domain-containing protein n=1 Tax=unclassified Streptomyces TaxID=2593676 RepID=UPI00371A61C5
MTMVPAEVHDDLFEAVYGGDEDAVVRLMRSGAPAEATSEDGTTALYAAAVCDHPGIARLLLAAGADPDRGSGETGGDLPLCGAACGGHTGVVRALLAAGAWPDRREEFGFTAMAWAVRHGFTDIVRVLLEHGADPGMPAPHTGDGGAGDLPLVAAARRGSASLVRTLLGYGAPGREQALREARRWLDSDVERVLRDQLEEMYGDGAETVVRRVPEDGGVTVVVEVVRDDGTGAGQEQQTAHAAIATLLEAALGERTPPDELAARALRCGAPEQDDWTEAVAVLRRRGDEETFDAAVSWCASDDVLRQALGADVLAGFATRDTGSEAGWDVGPGAGLEVGSDVGVEAGLDVGPEARSGSGPGPSPAEEAGAAASVAGAGGGAGVGAGAGAGGGAGARAGGGAGAGGDGGAGAGGDGGGGGAVPGGAGGAFSARVLPVLRELAREAVAAELLVPVLAGLGAHGDPAAAPDVLRHAAHPDPAVRCAVAAALGRLARAGGSGAPGARGQGRAAGDAVGALVTLTGDGEAAVRERATRALAGAPEDSPAVREALAARLTDQDPVAAAEAARGLATRQDDRAVAALGRILMHEDPEGAAYRIARAAVEVVHDDRTRRRLEHTFPRRR